MTKPKNLYVIKDWAGNIIHLPNRPILYRSFDDAEECLSEELEESYDTDRGEYFIEVVDNV